MIRNLSYNDKELREELEQLLGKPYSFFDILKFGSIGSPRMEIIEGSNEFQDYLNHGTGRKFCNIELRPKGIVVRFRYQLETMGFIVPFHSLKIFQNGNLISIHSDSMNLKADMSSNPASSQRFIGKVLIARLDILQQFDLPS